jgi:hypothetical protein
VIDAMTASARAVAGCSAEADAPVRDSVGAQALKREKHTALVPTIPAEKRIRPLVSR